MKPPLKVEKVRYEGAWSWELRDQHGKRVAGFIDNESEAQLIALLVNHDYTRYRAYAPINGAISDATEVDLERCEEDNT